MVVVAKTFLVMQKLTARLLIPLLAVWFVVQPGIATAKVISTYRVGSTVYPLDASGAMGAAIDIALLAGRASPWITGLTLGYQLAKFAVEGLDSSGAVVPLNVLPAGLAQAPSSAASWSGWTYDSVSKSWLPPDTAVGFSVYSPTYTGAPVYSSIESACSDSVRWSAAGYTFLTYSSSAISGNGFSCSAMVHYYGLKTIFSYGLITQGCHVGYSLIGGSCVLSNASLIQYPSDDAPTVIAKADGTGFALDPRDPDNASAPVSLPAYFQSQGVVNGRDTRVTIEPQTGGGLRVITEQQIINADGTVSTYRQTVITASDGAVQSTSGANFPGGLSEQTSQSTALVPSTSVEFPTDYNREVTQLAIRDELQAVGESTALAPGSEADAAVLRQHYNGRVDAAFIADTMTGSALPSLPGFLFPEFSAPVCHAIGWTFQGREVSFDICPHVPTIKSIAAWILNLLAAAICFQMIMNFRAMRLRG